MIGLPRTRASLLVTGKYSYNNLNVPADGVYMALTFFGAEQTAEVLLAKLIYTEPG